MNQTSFDLRRSVIRAVLFDLDATLVDDGMNWRQSVQQTVALVASAHPDINVESISTAYYEAAARVWEEIRGVEAPPFGNMDDPDIVRRVLGMTLEQVGIDLDETLPKAVTTYLGHRSAGAPAFDDAQECLEHLATHYRLGIVTNGAAAQQLPKLESAGLARFFGVVTTTDSGHGKPQPEIFMEALASLTTTPEQAAYVGDSLTWDVEGANRAGMTSIWLNRRGADRTSGGPVPDIEIPTLRDLPAALE